MSAADDLAVRRTNGGVQLVRVLATASVATPLMERTVCTVCGHMHRAVLVDKCGCCHADCKKQELDL